MIISGKNRCLKCGKLKPWAWRSRRAMIRNAILNAGGIQIGSSGIVVGGGGIVVTSADDKPCCCFVCTHCASRFSNVALSITSGTDCIGTCLSNSIGPHHYIITGSFPRGPWDGVQDSINHCLFKFVVPVSITYKGYTTSDCSGTPWVTATMTSITFGIEFGSGTTMHLFVADSDQVVTPPSAAIGNGGSLAVDEVIDLDGDDCFGTFEIIDDTGDSGDVCSEGAAIDSPVFAVTVS